MSDSEAGPSAPKIPRKGVVKRYQTPLTAAELEKLLYDSDCDVNDPDYEVDEEFEEDSDSDIEERVVQQPSEDLEESDQATDTPVVHHQTFAADMPKWDANRSRGTQINFSKNREMLVLPNGNNPIDFFNLLVDDSFYELIVRETNRYAVEIVQSPGISEFSRITRWKDITAEELKIFFGLLLHMGTISVPRLQDYWKKDPLFNMQAFSSNMSRDRFLLIMRCLHFAKNPGPNDPRPEDRLFKIRPLVDYFNHKMENVYYPDKNLSLDESMVLWRGRLLFRQYIKNKRHKYGIKLYMLTEPDGTILKFAVYTGVLDNFGGTGHAANIVLHLMEEKLDVGHAVFMDNFYNSYDLARNLLERGTYCTGTLRIDRKKNPEDVKRTKLKKGETIARYSNGVMIAKWHDKRDVFYISTEFGNDMITFANRRNQEVTKPEAVAMYNRNMGGIDKKDQMMAYYPCERKTLRWYKKLGVHIFQMLLVNSYFLYKKFGNNPRMSLYDFRLIIIRDLLPGSTIGTPSSRRSPINVGQLAKSKHLPEKNPISQKGKRTIQKKCKFCSSKKIRKDTIYYCPACPNKPPLCIECFAQYHEFL